MISRYDSESLESFPRGILHGMQALHWKKDDLEGGARQKPRKSRRLCYTCYRDIDRSGLQVHHTKILCTRAVMQFWLGSIGLEKTAYCTHRTDLSSVSHHFDRSSRAQTTAILTAISFTCSLIEISPYTSQPTASCQVRQPGA